MNYTQFKVGDEVKIVRLEGDGLGVNAYENFMACKTKLRVKGIGDGLAGLTQISVEEADGTYVGGYLLARELELYKPKTLETEEDLNELFSS